MVQDRNFERSSSELTKKQKRHARLSILGWNILTFLYMLFYLGIMFVVTLLLYVELGPRERYVMPVLLVVLLIASLLSKPLALKMYKAKRVRDENMLATYKICCRNTKILGVIPMVGVFQPPLYSAKMGGPNAFCTGSNLLWLAQLPLIGSAIVLSDELLEFGLTPSELRGIMLHELHHAASWDVAFASAMSSVRSTFTLMMRIRTVTLLSVEFVLLTILFAPWLFIAYLFTVSISQMRELCADHGAVLALGRARPLVNALTRLSEHQGVKSGPSLPFDDLFSGHPRTSRRCELLNKL